MHECIVSGRLLAGAATYCCRSSIHAWAADLNTHALQVTAYRAGHVLGACMFQIEIAGMKALYTGDYSRLPDRHLSAADIPDSPPDIGAPANLCCCPHCIHAPHTQLHQQTCFAAPFSH